MQRISQGSKRLTILTEIKIEDLYGLPQFDEIAQASYFELDHQERSLVDSMRSLKAKICFILQLGYFKHRFMFFSFTLQQAAADAHYIIQHHFPGERLPQSLVSKKTRLKQQAQILSLFGYTAFNQKAKQDLLAQALKIIRQKADPAFIFDHLLSVLNEKRICLPGYTTLQDIVSQAIVIESKRLHAIISKQIPRHAALAIKRLLEGEDDIDKVSGLKKDAKGFKHQEILKEIDKKMANERLYRFTRTLIPKLKISKQNMGYYASLVDYYTIDKLRMFPCDTSRLYLLCYVFYRFQKLNDNLVQSFIFWINDAHRQARDKAKEKVYESKTTDNSTLKQTGVILNFFVDPTISNETPFGHVRTQVFKIMPEKDICLLTQHIAGIGFDEVAFKWDHYMVLAQKMKRTLRPLVQAIDFAGDIEGEPLMRAATFLKKAFQQCRPLNKIDPNKFPIDFIPTKMLPYIFTITAQDSKNTKVSSQPSMKLDPYRYEFLVYVFLERFLDAGKVFVNNSLSYKRLQDDLIADKKWQNKDKILRRLGNSRLLTPIAKQQAELKEQLHTLLQRVNTRLNNGQNKDLKIKNNDEWALPYVKERENLNNPFYAQLPQINISTVLRFVEGKCSFLKAFTHIKPRYSKSKADEDAILASITANATNFGIAQMAGLCDIGYKALLTTSQNFIRLETLRSANDILANKTAEFPLFRLWDVADNKLFSGLDGQKFRTRYRNAKSQYSRKYFGHEKGIVVYSMVANHVPLNTKIIGANEHESHYVFDLVYNNTSEIKPDWHCGDSHSINQVNFALLDLIGQSFSPHLKSINSKINAIYCFEGLTQDPDDPIQAHGKINTKLIEEEWDNLQRIFASLLLSQTTQSIIVKKLSSYARKNRTQQALWEYDKIHATLHILRFIDEITLRRSIRKAQNRIEAYHRLKRKIATINDNKFRGTSEREMEIWNECSRLLANCVIYYNACILSILYERYEQSEDKGRIEKIKAFSPVAWQHINFNGRYEFTIFEGVLDLKAMVAQLNINF